MKLKEHFLSMVFYFYAFWSKLYRKIWQRKYKKIKLSKGLVPNEAQKLLDKMEWRKDSYKEFFDSIGSPNWFQYCLNEVLENRAQPKGSLDCDDFASWFAHAIHPRFRPQLLSVMFVTNDGVMTGHAVCVWEDDFGKYYHSGVGFTRGHFRNYKEIIKDLSVVFDAKSIIGGFIFPCLRDKCRR